MAGSNPVTVRIAGLSELRAALKELDKNANRELGKALFAIATGIAGKVSSVMPHLSGAAAGTVAPHRKAGGASVSIGTGEHDDYVPWLDFGGRVGRYGSIRRPIIKGGRYLYPQIAASRAQTIAAVDAALGKAAQAAGFTTTGHST